MSSTTFWVLAISASKFCSVAIDSLPGTASGVRKYMQGTERMKGGPALLPVAAICRRKRIVVIWQPLGVHCGAIALESAREWCLAWVDKRSNAPHQKNNGRM